MEFNDHLTGILIKLLVSTIVGLVIGAEREYRNKSAGLRTIMLICLGSTIFTIVSIENSHPSEIGRIASNIVTGIGFLGAGAIIREGMSVSGLTTASTIWVAAALGMSVGMEQYGLTVMGTVIALSVLTVFGSLQKILDRLHRTLDLQIVFKLENNGVEEFEQQLKERNIKFLRKKENRRKAELRFRYEIWGRAKRVDDLVAYMNSQKDKIKSFEY